MFVTFFQPSAPFGEFFNVLHPLARFFSLECLLNFLKENSVLTVEMQ